MNKELVDVEMLQRRLKDAQKTLDCLAKRNVELRNVAAMLAEELTELHKQREVYREEAGESSPALIAYRGLVGEK